MSSLIIVHVYACLDLFNSSISQNISNKISINFVQGPVSLLTSSAPLIKTAPEHIGGTFGAYLELFSNGHRHLQHQDPTSSISMLLSAAITES